MTGIMQRFKGRIAASVIQMSSNAFFGTTTNAITAHAGGTRAAAVRLTASLNRISVCATTADSVALPPAKAGMGVIVVNDGAASARVFADTTTSDTIDGVAAATGVVLTNARRALFFAPANAVWISVSGVASI